MYFEGRERKYSQNILNFMKRVKLGSQKDELLQKLI
jgi:hypothetical protein